MFSEIPRVASRNRSQRFLATDATSTAVMIATTTA
jgi:hypothetical protein